MTLPSQERSLVRVPWTWVMLLSGCAAILRSAVVAGPTITADLATHGRVVTVYLVALIVGEMARVRMPGGRTAAPLSSASALALAFTFHVYSEPDLDVMPAFIVLVVATGLLLGALLRWLSGLDASLPQVAVRLIGLSVAAAVAHRWRPWGTLPIVEEVDDPSMPLFLIALAMVVVGLSTMSMEVVLTGLLRSERLGTRVGPALRDEVAEALPLTAAVVVAGPFTALIQPVFGLASLPFALFPVALSYVAVRRYAANRATYREIISTLSRMTERGGYTPVDHAERVASLAVRVGRHMGVPERSIPDLEYAALLHDLGQIALREPIPGGATTSAAPADQTRIASDGAAIVRSTAVLELVAQYIEQQAALYRDVRERDEHVPIESRIIKVVNAFDDLTLGEATTESVAAAMERLSLGLGYEYDPDVVEALAAVLDSAPSPRELPVDR